MDSREPPALPPAARYASMVAQGDSDGDEVLRMLILAVLAKSDRPLDAEELAERVAAMLGVRLSPERGH